MVVAEVEVEEAVAVPVAGMVEVALVKEVAVEVDTVLE